jgi:hypothetical protein
MKIPPTGAAIRRSANGKDRIKRESRRSESFFEGWEENQCFSLNSRLTALNLRKHEMCSSVHARFGVMVWDERVHRLAAAHGR